MSDNFQHPLRQKAPPAIAVTLQDDTVVARNYKAIQNMAGIEIAELRDSLAYAEYQYSKAIKEKEELEKKQTSHTFVVKEIEDRLRKAENDKEALSRDVVRAEGKAKQIEMNQDQVSDISLVHCVDVTPSS
jgi:predicted nuclease with TOPRIM domain